VCFLAKGTDGVAARPEPPRVCGFRGEGELGGPKEGKKGDVYFVPGGYAYTLPFGSKRRREE